MTRILDSHAARLHDCFTESLAAAHDLWASFPAWTIAELEAFDCLSWHASRALRRNDRAELVNLIAATTGLLERLEQHRAWWVECGCPQGGEA